jgi:hypothetical protein
MRALQAKLLSRAVAISGNAEQLAFLLGVDEHRLSLWRADQATMPDAFALRIVDLILEDDIRRAAQDRREQPRDEQAPGLKPVSPARN